ncbi:hypothetical protein HMI54_003325 [Coelomomyces lativittatus]|nr:hypothetical protein HMI54_003325 [Coelomomyces lativittatus]KAJ1512854.1 hypothetical protein HMI55_006081 [Coelomomyces lativittatus]
MKYWDFGKDTVLDTNQGIHLTLDAPGRIGWIWSRLLLYLKEWEMELEFRISTNSLTSSSSPWSSSSTGGEGFAFWYTSHTYAEGPAMGYQSYWQGLGIVVDTLDQTGGSMFKSAWIAALVNDGTHPYDPLTNGKSLVKGSCERRLVNRKSPTRFRIQFKSEGYLRLDTITKSEKDWKICFELNNLTLPDKGFFGLTAKTLPYATAQYTMLKMSTQYFLPAGPRMHDNDDVDEWDYNSNEWREDFNTEQSFLYTTFEYLTGKGGKPSLPWLRGFFFVLAMIVILIMYRLKWKRTATKRKYSAL